MQRSHAVEFPGSAEAKLFDGRTMKARVVGLYLFSRMADLRV